MLKTLVTIWVVIAGTLAFVSLSLVVDGISPVLGQELLPDAGTDQPIGKPNTNVTVPENNNDYPAMQGSILDPFFGR